ncbi:hypothetical protein J4G08_13630 [Candidatus Poribacteria bacterium]|nr:hypothetical protein [Candidatus Poribacteria bacterium]
MRKFSEIIIIATLCFVTVGSVVGQFNNQRPGESVYIGTFQSLARIENRDTLTSVNLSLHSLPDGFIKKPIEIWPSIKLTPKEIVADLDIQLGSTEDYAAITRGVGYFFKDANQKILLKKIRWSHWSYDHFIYQNPFSMEVDIYTIKENEEIKVINGYFDVGKLSQKVFQVKLENSNRIWNERIHDTMIPLHPLPEDFISKPKYIWPAIQLTPQGIFAQADLRITGISTEGIEGATEYLKKLIREANNQITIKNMIWMAWWDADGYDKVGIECEIYIMKDGKEINVGEHMIESGYAKPYDGC